MKRSRVGDETIVPSDFFSKPEILSAAPKSGDPPLVDERDPDDDPYDLTRDGLLAVLTPKDPYKAVDSEDDVAFRELEDDTSPGEAQRILDTMRPLSVEEEEILDELPSDMDDFRKVDDPDEEQWLLDRKHEGYHAMDTVLDDSLYGDAMTTEEQMERLGTDDESGFGFGFIKNIGKKIGSTVKKGVTAPLSAAKWVGKKTIGQVMRFVPGRDAGKAKMVRDAYNKMVREHANWLGLQDQKAGRPVRPASFYQAQSRPWASAQLRAAGLPTTTKVSGADVLGAEIAGEDVMGAWWNPLSWFSNIINTIFRGPASQQMSPTGPTADGQMPMTDEYGNPIDPNAAASPDAGYPSYDSYDSYADQSTQDFYPGDQPMEAYPDYAYGDVTAGISGDDSLGAVTAEIFAGKKTPSKDDQMVALAVKKLRSGYPLGPGELAVLATLAKAGHPEAKKVYAVLLAQGTSHVSGAAPASKADQMMAAAVKKLRSGYPLKPGEFAIVAKLAKSGHPIAKSVYATLMQSGVAKIQGDDESGDWLYKLNPLRYVMKSAQERALEDKEREAWSQNAELRKQLEKRQVVLSQAEKAQVAQAAVAQAKEQAAATEAQLKAIESSLSGVGASSFVGHEKPTAISKVVSAALAKAGKLERAKELRAKIASGKPLDKAELADARAIAKVLRQVKVVHGDLISGDDSGASGLHDELAVACLRGDVAEARRQNAVVAKAATVLTSKIDPKKPLDPEHEKAVRAVAKKTSDLRDVVRSHVSGRAYRGLEGARSLQKSIVAGAVKAAMQPAEAKMLQAIRSLAKAGNPRAAEALKRLQAAGTVAGGDFVGISFSLSDAFKYATAPVWWPAQKLYQGAKWVGQKTGIISKGGSSPQDVRLAKMRAAYQRRKAAEAKAAAADAQTEAELRAQQSIVDSANAEADAADAEALSKEAAMRTAELEADPTQSADYVSQTDLRNQSQDDTSGEFVGDWENEVGAQEKKLVKKAGEKSATGMKIRSGAAFYRKVKKGDPQAKAALRTMIEKSQKGDRQAMRDINVVYAGMKAQKAKEKAQLKAAKKQARLAAAKARKAKVLAAQKRYEAAIANKLVRAERKHELRKLGVVEKKSAAGDARAKKYVATQATLARGGDKKAADRLAKMKLMRQVRKAAPTKRERRNIASAGKLYRSAAKGNPKAVRQVKVLEAAAKRGNPNAKRAIKRLDTARKLELVVVTGSVAGATAVLAKKSKKKRSPAENQAVLAKAKVKASAGTGSREELAAGAQAASELGDKKTAGALAVAAAKAPSATETLQKTAEVVKAKQAGNPEATAAVNEAFEKAKAGDAAEIKKMGNVVATQTLDDIQQGRPVPPAMRDAVNLQERAAAGDKTALEMTRQISEAATGPSPTAEATAAAITLTAAAVTAKALAAKPKARDEFMAAVNPPLPPAEAKDAEAKLEAYRKQAKDGTITAEDGLVAEKLAERLRKPKVAAEIAAYAPPPPPSTPMSSLPEMPQAPITGKVALVKEVLRALTFSTRDPLANYREGIASRARTAVPTTKTAGSDDAVGWSPFDWFRRNIGIILPSLSTAASAATLAVNVANKSAKPKAAPTQAPATVAQSPKSNPFEKPAPAPSVASEAAKPNPFGAKTAASTETSSSGADTRTLKDFVSQAIADKKMSRRDFNRAVEAQTGTSAAPTVKTAVGQKVLEFLTKKGVKVET